MDKIKLKLSEKSDVEISFFGVSVFLNTLIKISEQGLLKNTYLESLFTNGKEDEWDEQFAEFMLRREILKIKTNIDVDSLSLSEVDLLIWGEFFDKVSSSIINYYSFRESLDKSVSNKISKIKIESGLGYMLSGVIEKFKPFIDELMKMTPEEIEKLKTNASEIVEKTKEEPMASVISDMGGNKKKRTKKEK